MNIQLVSDLHNEFYKLNKENPNEQEYTFVPEEAKPDTVLVMAGDVHCNMVELDTYIEKLLPFFKAIVHVPGNHEYYHNSIEGVELALQEMNDRYENFHSINDDEVVIEDTVFLGATMWTDFGGGLQEHKTSMMAYANYRMRDYQYITNAGTELTPQDVLGFHDYSKARLEERLSDWRDKDKKVVVVTHHAPLFKELKDFDYRHDGETLNCYYNRFNEMIMDYKPKLWVYGHTHASTWIKYDETIICSNPFGYVNYELNHNFDVDFIIDMHDEPTLVGKDG